MTDASTPRRDQPANPSTALAEVIVDELARGGVTDVVVCPGSRSAALAMAVHHDPRLRVHVQIDERSAAFLALGLGRSTRRPAAVVTTSGSAVANLLPAVVEADHAAVPLLLVTADRPVELRHTGANQTVVQPGMFGASTRWTIDIGAPEDRADAVVFWRATVSRAIAESVGVGGRAGPVHLNVGFREPTVPLADDGRSPVATWTHPIAGRADGSAWTAAAPPVARPGEAAIAALAARASAAERGLLIVGDTDAEPDAVLALGDALGWPVLAEGTSPVRFAGNGTVVGGATSLLAHDGVRRAGRPDLVVRIGRTSSSSSIDRAWRADIAQVGVVAPGAWHDERRVFDTLLVADPTVACQELAARVHSAAPPRWRQWWQTADGAVAEALAAELDASDELTEPLVARRVVGALPAGGALVVAASMPIRDVDRFARPRADVRLHANRGASGIDGLVSTTLGVALGAAAPTVGLLGDLAFLHDSNGVLVAPRPAEPVVFVVIDNDGGGIFSFLPPAAFPASFEPMFGTPHGRDLSRLAELHGLAYSRPDEVEAFGAALTTALETAGTHLVHVRTDRERNVEVHRALASAVRTALDEFLSDRLSPG